MHPDICPLPERDACSFADYVQFRLCQSPTGSRISQDRSTNNVLRVGDSKPPRWWAVAGPRLAAGRQPEQRHAHRVEA